MESRTNVRKSIAFVVGFTVITFLHIVAGEQAPKSFGIRQPLSTALWVAYPMRVFYFLAFPFIWLLNESSLGLLRVLGLQPAHEHEGASSEEELSVLVATAQKHFGASRFSRDLVQNALDLRHRVARDVMRPRQEITMLDTEATDRASAWSWRRRRAIRASRSARAAIWTGRSAWFTSRTCSRCGTRRARARTCCRPRAS